jgi:effector-binding domain-containing protein
MPYVVAVKEVPPQHVAQVLRHTPVERLGPTIDEAFRTLMSSLERAHEHPTGPPLIVYDRMDLPGRRAEIEVCVPVGYRYLGDDDVRVEELSGCAVAFTTHRGPYEGVGDAYEALAAWIGDNAMVVDGPPREIYLTDPNETPDPADLVTEIEFPVG